MQLPVDVMALLDETTNIKAARATPVSISVCIDEAAPAELAAHVRNAFASTSPHVRMTVAYLDSSFNPRPTDDLAVVVAGESGLAGRSAAQIRAVGVPVMVATLSPVAVARAAEDAGYAIPDGDVVAPGGEGGAWAAAGSGTGANDSSAAASEPILFDDAAAFALDERMGAWIVSVCHDKRLALSIAFPFMRRALATDAVRATALQNAGVGLVSFIPGADLPIMTLNQAKMMLQIAAAYGRDVGAERLKELAAVVGGAYLSRTLARKLMEFVPVLGFLVRTGVAYGSTAAMGFAIIEYYEGGEDATGVANVATKAGEAGVHALAAARDIAADPSSISFDRVNEAVAVVRDKANEYVPRAIELAAEYAPQAKDVIVDSLAKFRSGAQVQQG